MRRLSKAILSITQRRLLPALLLLCGLPTPGTACSPDPSYRVPTNFELVQRADLIVVALVAAGPELPAPSGGEADHVVQIAPMQVLKGVLPAQPIALRGLVGLNGTAFESMPTPLSAAHYSVRLGACTRQYYAKGSLVVAMFETSAAGMRPIAAPFARAVEDVESFDSLWVRTARRYVAIQESAGAGALRPAVRAERDRLRAEGADMEARAVAADLGLWLAREEGGIPRPIAWNYADGPNDLRVFALGPAERPMPEAPAASVRCRRDGTALDLDAQSRSKPASLGLMIGTHIVDAADLRPVPESQGREWAGTIAFTPDLERLLKESAEPFGIAIDGKASVQGEAGDAFEKFAQRCEALLRP